MVALLAWACAVKAPPRQVWSLTPRGAALTQSSAARAGVLAVRRFSAAEEIRTTHLTWRRSEGRELVRAPGQSWADYPDRLLEEMALASFGASGRFSAVLTAPPWGHVDGVLSCRLVDFSAWDDASGRRARVAVRWSLATPGGVILEQGVAEETAAIAGEDVTLVVNAFQAAADVVIGRLVEATVSAMPPAPPS